MFCEDASTGAGECLAGWAYLDRVEETESTAAGASKVVIPEGEGLEGVHERTIETVGGGRDEAAGWWLEETVGEERWRVHTGGRSKRAT